MWIILITQCYNFYLGLLYLQSFSGVTQSGSIGRVLEKLRIADTEVCMSMVIERNLHLC